ncbi:hypothetical protein NHH03_27010 [Stieleria sp. TO1_6]|uniref:hypothetical protein n=1 Tax=Stieleria tagensis TaxID=2956795 RepID=UPI00209A99FB|nr:hypothetical protein [Stieleria tagensis]MCO8125418.1 hypothetical protein [Stieleria tagensis]
MNPNVTPNDNAVIRVDEDQGSVRRVICGSIATACSVALLIQFADSKWGDWPWYFSPREPGFDRIELFLFFFVPIGITGTIALFAGRAKYWILGLLSLTIVLSLV